MANQLTSTYNTRQPAADVQLSTEVTRLQWVDYARGIAIMLVVYRHVIVGMKRAGFEVSSTMYDLQEVVYNFRMPVFFVLSGIFLAGSLKRHPYLSIAKNRAYTILYPYIIWGGITVVMQILFSNYTNSKRQWTDLLNLFMDPRGIDHLWYLLALFNTNILYLLLNKLIKNDWIHGGIALFMYFFSRFPIMHGNSFVADMFYFYLYLFVGAKISAVILDKEKIKKVLNFSHLLWVVPLVLLGQWFWFSIWQREDYAVQELRYLLVFFVINLLACYFVYLVSYKISFKSSMGWLSYLGKHSLYIYIMHVFVASVIRNIILHLHVQMNPWLVAFICWTFGLLVPVALFRLLKPYGFERLFSLKPSKG